MSDCCTGDGRERMPRAININYISLHKGSGSRIRGYREKVGFLQRAVFVIVAQLSGKKSETGKKTDMSVGGQSGHDFRFVS
jgi:hypothetical protein